MTDETPTPDLTAAVQIVVDQLYDTEDDSACAERIATALHAAGWLTDPAEGARLRARGVELEGEFEPGRWWRVVYDAPGGVWCESSNEREVRASLKTCPSPGTLQRLYEQTRVAEWRDVESETERSGR